MTTTPDQPKPPPRSRSGLISSKPKAFKPTGTFTERMARSREHANLRLDDAAVFARQYLASSWGVSRETIRRYENGDTTEDKVDPTFLAALAKVYGVKLDDLSPSAAARLRSITALAADVLGEGPAINIPLPPHLVPPPVALDPSTPRTPSRKGPRNPASDRSSNKGKRSNSGWSQIRVKN